MRYVPKRGGIACRAMLGLVRRPVAYAGFQAQVEASRAHWAAYRAARGMPKATYTRMDKIVVQRSRR